MHCPFHTRTGGEGQILPPPPPIFSRISKQRRRTAPPCLAYLLRILKKHLVWKSWTPRSKGQVTRSGQIRNITSAPASKFKIALWTQFESEWYQNFGVQYGHGLIQNAYPGFLNPRPAVGQNLPPPHYRIFAITPKPLQILTRNLGHLILHQFDFDYSNLIEISSKMFEQFAVLWRHYKPFLVKIA